MLRLPVAVGLLLLFPIQGSADSGRSLDRLNEEGFAPLHLAAIRGDCQGAMKLLASGANVNVQQRTFEGTPLQYAAARGHVDLVRLLVQYDAKVDAVDTFGRTPLMWAASHGYHEVACVLLDAGANVKLATSTGWTALHYAVKSDDLKTALLLAQRGAPLEARNSLDMIPAEIKPSE